MKNDKPALFKPGIGKRGITSLHHAAYCGDQIELERCLAAGMDPNEKDNYRGYTAVLWLADRAAVGGLRIEMLHTLVRYGADIHIASNDGRTALMLAREAGSAGGDGLAAALLSLGARS